MLPSELDVDAYAALVVMLSDESAERDAILRAHGLDEEAWEALDQDWQQVLSSAMDVDVETEGVPEVLARYSAAFVRAQQARKSAVLSIDHWALATRRISRSEDVAKTLSDLGLTLPLFLEANLHWTKRMLEEPALADRFRKTLLAEKE